MVRQPPRSTLSSSSAASDVYKRQEQYQDAAYSDFVEAADNQCLYRDYLHWSFLELLQPQPGQRLLDLATGNAVLSRRLLGTAHELQIVGVDQSQPMLDQATQLRDANGISTEQLQLVCGDVSDLGALGLGKFDQVISGFFFAHAATKDDLLRYWTNIADSMLPGGRTLHIIPEVPQAVGEGDGITVELPVEREGGQEIIQLVDFLWTRETYCGAAVAAGLVDVSIEEAKLNPESRLVYDELPIFVFLIRATKPRV
eukprot:TRINITY_DN11918_c0_g1_i1.p1 TRINITY_DN11918_c0_g1~~TRINITY_DN11918_c0_g1_i1.p1  ORF type:complete len:256 (+),score=61.05 TRINITY_DN11918_c0_g1_i1:70-837(+)